MAPTCNTGPRRIKLPTVLAEPFFINCFESTPSGVAIQNSALRGAADDSRGYLKDKLRQDALRSRDKIHNPLMGVQLRDNFLRNVELPAGCVIGAYWPIGSEIDVRPLINELYIRGYNICLPCIEANGDPLNFLQWEPEAVKVKSPFFKIYEPCKKHHEDMLPDVLIVPMVAFSKARHRLGYGGGFYDRTIAKLKPQICIGVAYNAQEIKTIPNEGWDMKLDRIVTENKVL